MTFGSRVRRAREDLKNIIGKNVSQGDLAVLCGWGDGGQQKLSNIERDKTEPSIQDIIVLSQNLNRSVAWLVTGNELTSNEVDILLDIEQALDSRIRSDNLNLSRENKKRIIRYLYEKYRDKALEQHSEIKTFIELFSDK